MEIQVLLRICRSCGEAFAPELPRKGRLTGWQCNLCRSGRGGKLPRTDAPAAVCGCAKRECQLLDRIDDAGTADYLRCRELDGKDGKLQRIAVARKQLADARRQELAFSSDYVRRESWEVARKNLDSVLERVYRELLRRSAGDFDVDIEAVFTEMAGDVEAIYATVS